MRPRNQTIVLIHGLWMNTLFTRYLGRFFRRAGYNVVYFSYRTTLQSSESAQLALHRLISGISDEVIHLVAHSLGGLLTIKMLNTYKVDKLGRVVLLASPVKGNKVAQVMGKHRVLKRMLGKSLNLLQQGARPDQKNQYEVGMLAGTVGLGLGRLITHVKKPCDGAVAEIETKADWLCDHRSLPVSHSGILFSSSAAAQVLTFIREGRFSYQAK